mgnify:CR=1 FL=1
MALPSAAIYVYDNNSSDRTAEVAAAAGAIVQRVADRVGAVGIVLGLATYGWKVIATVGQKITELTPSRGFAATLAAIMQGSTETTFYVLAVYFGSVGIKRVRHAIT